jgi:FkbM family methyltransferase
MLHIFFSPFRKGTLVYVGLNRGLSLERIHHRYARIIALEPNPNLMPELLKRFAYAKNVALYPFAAAQVMGWSTLHLPSNGAHDASASLSQFSESSPIQSVGSIYVPTVNLLTFLLSLGVDSVDMLVTDCEGFDLEVLRTMEPWITTGRIGYIQCEVQVKAAEAAYVSVSNYEEDVDAFLSPHFRKVGTGWGILKEGCFSGVPTNWRFRDVLYKNAGRLEREVVTRTR